MKTASPSPADISARIVTIEHEIRGLEASGPDLGSRLAAVEAGLSDARAFFEMYGFDAIGVLPAERLMNFRRQTIGALMMIDSNALLVAERSRAERQHRDRGGSVYSDEEKTERLAELRAELRPLLAAREAAWRGAERGGQEVDRGAFDPEMFLISDDDLAAIAGGRERMQETAV